MNEAEWRRRLEKLGNYDFYHTYAYHRLEAERCDGTPCLFWLGGSSGAVALPLILRTISLGSCDSVDATSVYGYAGPLVSPGGMAEEDVCLFQKQLRERLRELDVVSVFSRLHPLMAQQATIGGLGSIEEVGPTVSVDLTLPEEQQVRGYRSNVRREIVRLVQGGFECEMTARPADVDAFAAIYAESMNRVGASTSYYFERPYFDRIRSSDEFQMHLFVCKAEGKVVSGGLFSSCNGIAQYHLSGTSGDYLAVSPTKLLIDTARRWAADTGHRILHLGGGVGGQEDGLLRFKKGFSRSLHFFRVWKWIVDEERYASLCAERTDSAPASGLPDSYFPYYRR